VLVGPVGEPGRDVGLELGQVGVRTVEAPIVLTHRQVAAIAVGGADLTAYQLVRLRVDPQFGLAELLAQLAGDCGSATRRSRGPLAA
jgi:hypothetical protein